MNNASVQEGDAVATPDGRGVVAAVLTEDFEFPQGADDLTAVRARQDEPAIVIGLERGGSAVYRTDALEPTSFETDEVDSVEGSAETEIVSEDVEGLEKLPEGWDRESVLEYWNSIGGSWETCVDDLTDEFERDRAERLCSAMKDEVLGTTRWRNRF